MIPVYYPDAGRRFVLHWSTDDRRGRIALATSEASLQHLARRIFDDSPHAEIKALLEVELVAPSRKLCREVAEKERKREVDTFMHDVCCHVERVREAGKPLPPLFAKCEEYVVDPRDIDEDDETSVEDQMKARVENDPEHYSCAACTDSIRLVGITKEQLYDQYFERWCAEVNTTGYAPARVNPKQPQPAESRARLAGDDETLGAAVANFWDHSQGGHLASPDAAFGNDSLLFFYVEVRELGAMPYVSMLQAAREVEVAKRKAREERGARKHDDQKAEVIAKTIAFFGGSP